jgi:hypothetical protein
MRDISRCNERGGRGTPWNSVEGRPLPLPPLGAASPTPSVMRRKWHGGADRQEGRAWEQAAPPRRRILSHASAGERAHSMNAAVSCSIPAAAPSRARHKPREMPERGSGAADEAR